MDYPRFEKIDEHTIKIIMEKASNVPLAQILQNKEKLLEKKSEIEEALKHIDVIIAEAKKLDITAKVEPKKE